MFCTALLTGLALPTAGMLLQTLFKNPLAGPSVTGVSAFSALAITLFISITSASGWRSWENSSCLLIFFAFFGALSALLILSIFVRYVSNPIALIIAGFMLSALAGAIVSSLERFSPSEQIKAYMGWTMGSFSGLNFGQLAIFALFVF